MANAFSLDGRVAIVTGAAGGIGAATARLFVERGARVALADIDLDRAQAVADQFGGAAVALHVDLAEADTIGAMVEAAVAAFGGIDILHNNAAYQNAKQAEGDLDVETLDLDVWDRTLAVNLRGTMLACRFAMPHLKAHRRGAIVNTVSNLGLQGHVVALAYGSSKAALIHLTRSIAASHGRQGVRCNAVAPGMTLTPALVAQVPPPVRDMVAAETVDRGQHRRRHADAATPLSRPSFCASAGPLCCGCRSHRSARVDRNDNRAAARSITPRRAGGIRRLRARGFASSPLRSATSRRRRDRH